MPQVIHFSIQDKSFAMDMTTVYAIESTNKLPDSIADLLPGQPLMVNGQETLFFDLHDLFDGAPMDHSQGDQRLILTDDGQRKLACLVHQVGRVVEVAESQFAPLPPVCDLLSTQCFPKVLRHADDLILVVDPAGLSRVLGQAEADLAKTSQIETGHSPQTEVEIEDGLRATANWDAAVDDVDAMAPVSDQEQSDDPMDPHSLTAEGPEDAVESIETYVPEMDPSMPADLLEGADQVAPVEHWEVGVNIGSESSKAVDSELGADKDDARTSIDPALPSQLADPADELPQLAVENELDTLVHEIDLALTGDKLETMVTRVVSKMVRKKVSQTIMQAIANA